MTVGNTSAPTVDMTERRMLHDAGWPVLLTTLTAAFVIVWSLELLPISLPMLLWTTFGVALGQQTLSRLLDYCTDGRPVRVLHMGINILAISGLAILWAMLGGLSAPAFALFFALPVVTLGLVSGAVMQCVMTVYAISLAWLVAIRQSPDLRLQLEQAGVPPVWDAFPTLLINEISGYGMLVGGAAQLQFMVVFSLAMIGVAATTAIVVALIRTLTRRLRLVSASGKRAENMALSFLSREDGFEMIIDSRSRQIIAISPALAAEVGETPDALVGCHFSTALAFPSDHPVGRLIESGTANQLENQVVRTGSGEKLLNIRTQPGTDEDLEFQRVSLVELRGSDYAQIVMDSFEETGGVVDAHGRIVFLTDSAKKLLPTSGDTYLANRLPLPAGWWNIGTRKKHLRRVSIGRQPYELHLSRREFFAPERELELTAFKLIPARKQ
tara:strand:+ start:1297 stop:2619 length:1323 start_codon:yes stop_codon:yes gene_type:complete